LTFLDLFAKLFELDLSSSTAALEEKPLKKVTPNLQQEEIRNPSAATEENTKFGKDRFKYWNLQITSFSNDFNSRNELKSPSSVKLLSVSSAFRRI
jgi:hypothetical protein